MTRFTAAVERAWRSADARASESEREVWLDPAAEASLARSAIEEDGAPLSRGKDRLVFDVGGFAVKAARHASGLDANLREASLWAGSPEAWRRWLAPVVAHDPDGRWLVMRLAEPGVDPDWYERFYAWSGSGRPDRPAMPPRKMLLRVEHPNEESEWMTYEGRPVLYDYA